MLREIQKHPRATSQKLQASLILNVVYDSTITRQLNTLFVWKGCQEKASPVQKENENRFKTEVQEIVSEQCPLWSPEPSLAKTKHSFSAETCHIHHLT